MATFLNPRPEAEQVLARQKAGFVDCPIEDLARAWFQAGDRKRGWKVLNAHTGSVAFEITP